MKTIAYFAAAALALSVLQPVGAFAAPKPAPKGVKCGNSYIAAGKNCTKTTTAAAPAKSMPMKNVMPMKSASAKPAAAPVKAAAAPAKMAAAKPAGKKCGNGYIAATAKCTKK